MGEVALDGSPIVVAVDDSAAMVAHVDGPEPVPADLWTLDLGRRFDAVLALSHLVNTRLRSRRLDLLRVFRRYVHENGVVVVQRYPPDWIPEEGSASSRRWRCVGPARPRQLTNSESAHKPFLR